MSSDQVVVLNQGLEQRTTKSGKQRFTVKIEAEPLIHKFNAKDLGKLVAYAIAQHLRDRLAMITSVAAPATIKARKVAARAVAAGKTWALRRYSGGRMGQMRPDTSDRLFNDSGRFEKSITASASGDDAWRINVAANRLSPATADHGGIAAIQTIWSRLTELIPEFGDPRELVTSLPIRRAIQNSQKLLVTKAVRTSKELAAELAEVLFESAKQTIESTDQSLAG